MSDQYKLQKLNKAFQALPCLNYAKLETGVEHFSEQGGDREGVIDFWLIGGVTCCVVGLYLLRNLFKTLKRIV